MTDYAYALQSAKYVGAMGQAAEGRGLGKNVIATLANQMTKGIDGTRISARLRNAFDEFGSVMNSATAPIVKPEMAPAPVTPISKARRNMGLHLTNG